MLIYGKMTFIEFTGIITPPLAVVQSYYIPDSAGFEYYVDQFSTGFLSRLPSE
jgi:hypothetical protein